MENNAVLPLSPADETLVIRHREIITTPVTVRLVYTDDDAGSLMHGFCMHLEKLLPNITVKREAADDEPPGIHVRDNIHFMMVPKGALLEFFLLTLLGNDALAGQDMGMDAGQVSGRIVLPAHLKMYIAENCPFCKQTIPKGLFLAGAAPAHIDLRLVDAMMFTAFAETDKVRSVPVTLLDNTFRWNGDFNITEVVDTIASRDPMKLGYETLKKMITDGDAEGVAALMHRFNTVIPAFTEMLVAEKWPERLGAMVAFEYLAETDPILAESALNVLWESFDALEPAIMGDVLHLVGVLNQAGQAGQAARLQAVLAGPYPQSVKAVAREIADGMRGF